MDSEYPKHRGSLHRRLWTEPCILIARLGGRPALRDLVLELSKKGEWEGAWEQMAKAGPRLDELLEKMAIVSSKVSPFYAAKLALNCENVCLDGLPPGGYPITKLFDDLVAVSDVDGFESLAKRIAIRNKQAVGFRYELELANICRATPGQVLAFVDFGIEVILDEDGRAWTDVDVVCKTSGGATLLYQAKRTAAAFSSAKGVSRVDKVKAWLTKAKKWVDDFGDEGAEIRYAVPSEDIVPEAVSDLLIREGVSVATVPSVPAWFDGQARPQEYR